MRGKGILRAVHRHSPGITPAYAGKRHSTFVIRSKRLGSPPPMRGKASVHGRLVRWLKDHPRLCGEKFCTSPHRQPHLGSPPPMRGKVPMWFFFCTVTGITPAYAGKSYRGGVQLQKIWDHPRLCGEKLKPRRRIETNQGSPPPMRGKASQ